MSVNKFKKGAEVMLSPDSEYYCENDNGNPIGTIGVVIYNEEYTIEEEDIDDYDIIVQWPSGITNNYREYDLLTIDEAFPNIIDEC